MKKYIIFFTTKILAYVMFVGLFLYLGSGVTLAQSVLPIPKKGFTGKIGLTYKDSASVKPSLHLPQSYGIENPPNIFLVLLDDAGYGQTGTFGGGIPTPGLDRLADAGLRYTQFHTTALCSPTRAALLTGRNHHNAGFGVIAELGTGFPGYNGVIPRSCGTIAEILKQYGYATAFFGKHHNVPDWETSAMGPFDRWPIGLGFDYFYGFIGGDTDQFHPALVENTTRIEPPEKNADGTPYHFTTDLADHTIRYLKNATAIAPQKPFFVYFATGATHAPHQVPKNWADKFKGRFDAGWDQYRQESFERQKKLGVIPKDARLTPRPKELPAWASLNDDQKRLYARMMELFAAFTAHTDHEINRVVDAIASLGEMDNTLIIYIVGDNGASAEGGLDGLLDENSFFNGLPEKFEDKLKAMPDLGGPKYFNHFPAAWAWAMNTPFQWTKQVASHFGGTRNGMVITWPAKIKDKGGVRYQFSHVNDITPTILDVLGIETPFVLNGTPQKPMDGISLAYSFGNAGAKTKHAIQYFELAGNQAIYHDGWWAGAMRSIPWLSFGQKADVLDLKWELYNIEKDYSQAVDLAEEYPKKLAEMEKLFFAEAGKYNVLPLDDRRVERFNVSFRPSLTQGRKSFKYYDHMRITEGSAPDVKHKNHTIIAKVVIPEKGAEGVLMTHGGRSGGYGVFIQEGKLIYRYNLPNQKQFNIVSEKNVPTGKVKLKVVYTTDEDKYYAGATVNLFANGKKIGKGRVEKSIPIRISIDETFDVGFDTGTPISETYKVPFDFTGNIESIEVNF